jgi:hypothetical protein
MAIYDNKLGIYAFFARMSYVGEAREMTEMGQRSDGMD